MSIFTNAKDKHLSSIILLLFTNLLVPGVILITFGKTERTLNESMEHAWSDKNSAINTHIDNSGYKPY